MIKTAHGRGFRFVARFDEVDGPETRAGPTSAARRALKPLIGRVEELADVLERLNAGRLVTLVGPGGVGKTHTMRHAAIDLNASIAELADVRDAASLPRTVLVAIGGSERPDTDPTDHHRSLETAIGWSVDLLNESQRLLLANLSVLVGSFDIAAATALGEAINGQSTSVVADLMTLTDLSLVAFEPSTGRYRLLESIRIYADSLGPDAEAQARHRDHIVDVIEVAGPIAPTEFRKSLRVFSDNWPNLRAVVERAVAAGDRDTLHRVIAAAIRCAEQTFAFEVLDWIDAAMALDTVEERLTPPNTQVCAALLLTHRGKLSEAADRLTAARDGDPDLLDLASMWHCYFSGDLAGAELHVDSIRHRTGPAISYVDAVAALAGHYLDKGAGRDFHPADVALVAAVADADEATATAAKLCAALRLDWREDADLVIEQLTEVVSTCSRLGLAFMASGASTALSIALAATPDAQPSLRGLRAALRSYAESGSWQFALVDFGATALSLARHGQALAAAEVLGARQAAGFVGDTSQKIAAQAADVARADLGSREFDEALRQGEARDTPTATRFAIAALSIAIGD